ADQGADDADDDVPQQAEAVAAHDLAGGPAGDETDEQDDKQAFVGKMHRRVLRASQPRRRRANVQKVPSDSGSRNARRQMRRLPQPPPAALTLPIIFWCISLVDWIAMWPMRGILLTSMFCKLPWKPGRAVPVPPPT